jgi:hypothetical protein
MDLPEQIVFKSGLAAYEHEYKFNSFLPQVGDIVAGLVLQAARNINNEYINPAIKSSDIL